MSQEFLRFVMERDRESFLRARAAAIEADGYEPYGDTLDQIGDRLEAGDLDAARDLIQDASLSLMLSPRLHVYAAALANAQGNSAGADGARGIAALCVDGILMSGDGSKNSPYLVLRTTDEYDVLIILKKQFARQVLVESDNRAFDRIECDDGTELWFEITDMINSVR